MTNLPLASVCTAWGVIPPEDWQLTAACATGLPSVPMIVPVIVPFLGYWACEGAANWMARPSRPSKRQVQRIVLCLLFMVSSLAVENEQVGILRMIVSEGQP